MAQVCQPRPKGFEMDSTATVPVTELLLQWNRGDEEAGERLIDLLYDDLHRVAAGCFHGERTGHTLQTTALIHEAWLRMDAARKVQWRDRNHFLSVAARVMRRVLVDHVRRRRAAKRGGWRSPVPLVEGVLSLPGRSGRDPDVLAVDQALERLEEMDPEAARLVELKFFGGATMREAAACLGVSRRTAHRLWRRARAWLYLELSGEAHDAESLG